jgi:hypothetical protein
MATWSLLLGAVLNLVALLLFGFGFRAPADHALRLERAALAGVGVTFALCVSSPVFLWARDACDFAEAYYFGSTYVGASAPLTHWLRWRAFLLQAALVPIPAATWLGLAAVRRAHAAPRA